MACYGASLWIGESLKCWSLEQSRHHNSIHHLGTMSFSWPALFVFALTPWWDFFTFWEVKWLGWEGGDGGKAAGGATHSAGCTTSWTSSCSGAWGGSTLPRRVASFSGVVEVLCSFPMGLRWEVLTIPLLLWAIRGAMHFCSSCADSQRTPVGNPDSLVEAWSTWANARVFSCLWPKEFLGHQHG